MPPTSYIMKKNEPKNNNTTELSDSVVFAPDGRWEAGHSFKILSRVMGTFSEKLTRLAGLATSSSVSSNTYERLLEDPLVAAAEPAMQPPPSKRVRKSVARLDPAVAERGGGGWLRGRVDCAEGELEPLVADWEIRPALLQAAQ